MKRIEAVKAWGGAHHGQLHAWAFPWKERAEAVVVDAQAVPVRIIREADYQRLLRAARPKRKPVKR